MLSQYAHYPSDRSLYWYREIGHLIRGVKVRLIEQLGGTMIKKKGQGLLLNFDCNRPSLW